MAFPTFAYCVICEIVRPELGGKFILLGFYGLAPNVEISVPDINRPVLLSIVAGCPPVPEANIAYECVVTITRPDGVGIVQTTPFRLAVSQGKGIVVPISFNIAPPILSGSYSVRLTVNGEVKLDTSFSIRHATPAGVNRQPSGIGAPNEGDHVPLKIP
jgi:hypothetical protein